MGLQVDADVVAGRPKTTKPASTQQASQRCVRLERNQIKTLTIFSICAIINCSG